MYAFKSKEVEEWYDLSYESYLPNILEKHQICGE